MGNGAENHTSFSTKRADVFSFEAYKQKKQQKERVGSAAFNLEYEKSYTDAELYDDSVSYLGEYRFQVPKFQYELLYGSNPNNLDEGVGIRDKHRRESMRIKSKRAVFDREIEGKPVHREMAETAAFLFLENQMVSAKSGDTLLWGSPPGPTEEGYGDYGFVFYGHVVEGKDGGGNDEKCLKMQAIRVEGTTLVQYNAFFNEFVESPVDFSHADEFLASPIVLSATLPEKFVDSALKKHFAFEIVSQEQEIFTRVIEEMNPLIYEYIATHRAMTNAEKLTAFNALENYALMLRDKYKTKFEAKGKVVFIDDYRYEGKQLQDIVGDFGHKPPVVSGSCGSTASESSLENITSSAFSRSRKELMKKLGIDTEEDEEGYKFDKLAECRMCSKKTMCGPCDMCMSCDISMRRKNGTVVPDYMLMAA